ncbi:MAG: hypothetical protein AAFQ63_12140 [Cyanobacteria bacterium J06621_11]
MADSVALSAPTLEGQLAEVAGLLKEAEIDGSAEVSRVVVLFDPENESIFIGASLPATFSHAGDRLDLTVEPYVVIRQLVPLSIGGQTFTVGGIPILI